MTCAELVDLLLATKKPDAEVVMVDVDNCLWDVGDVEYKEGTVNLKVGE